MTCSLSPAANPRPSSRPSIKVDPALLQRLREESGLRLDRAGNFWHRGTPVTHARTVAVLHQGTHRAPDGRWATRIGREWAYLEVEDTALFVRRIDGRRAQLASGGWAEIESLALGADDALYARIGGERARLTRAAQLSLSDKLREDSPGNFSVELDGSGFSVGRDPGPDPVKT